MLGKIIVPILPSTCVACMKMFISLDAVGEETLLPVSLIDILHWSKLLPRYLTQSNSTEMLIYFTRSDMPATGKEYTVHRSEIIESHIL